MSNSGAMWFQLAVGRSVEMLARAPWEFHFNAVKSDAPEICEMPRYQ